MTESVTKNKYGHTRTTSHTKTYGTIDASANEKSASLMESFLRWRSNTIARRILRHRAQTYRLEEKSEILLKEAEMERRISQEKDLRQRLLLRQDAWGIRKRHSELFWELGANFLPGAGVFIVLETVLSGVGETLAIVATQISAIAFSAAAILWVEAHSKIQKAYMLRHYHDPRSYGTENCNICNGMGLKRKLF